MMQSGLRAFQLLLGVAAVGGSIAAWQDAPRPEPPADVLLQLPAGAMTLPAVYIDAPPIVVADLLVKLHAQQKAILLVVTHSEALGSRFARRWTMSRGTLSQ